MQRMTRKASWMGLVLGLLLAAGGCSEDELQASFLADNALPSTRAWDNVISLQPGQAGSAERFTVVLHAGRADGASATEPAPPANLLLTGVTRLRGTLRYRPEQM